MMRQFILFLVLIAAGIDAKEISAAGLTPLDAKAGSLSRFRVKQSGQPQPVVRSARLQPATPQPAWNVRPAVQPWRIKYRGQPVGQQGDAKLCPAGGPNPENAGLTRGCFVVSHPQTGTTGYDKNRPGGACVAGTYMLPGYPCILMATPGYQCVSPMHCTDIAACSTQQFTGAAEGSVVGCHGATAPGRTTKFDLEINDIKLANGDTLMGATVKGTFTKEGGRAQEFAVPIGNRFFDCTAYGRTLQKLDVQGQAATTVTYMTAQADFFAEMNMALTRQYGLQFTGAVMQIKISLDAQAQLKASLSYKGFEANARIGATVQVDAEFEMKYFGAKATAKAGAYAEAGVMFKFNENWDLETSLKAGCFFGAQAEMKFGVGAAMYDVQTGVAGKMEGAWNSLTGVDYDCYYGDDSEFEEGDKCEEDEDEG